MAISLILAAASVWLFLLLLYPAVVRYLESVGMCRSNYRGNSIPVGAGIVIPVCQWIVLPWALKETWISTFLLQNFALLLISYAGWVDDKYGGSEAKGLRGHLRLWLKEKRISTGLGKALTGIALAALVSGFSSDSVFAFILHVVLVVLMTNLINLLDLRPGRAIKGFFLCWVPLMFLSFSLIPALLWLPTILAGAFLLRDDLRGRVMLGDTGANALGMALGCWMVFYAPLGWKLFAVLLAGAVHLYAEHKSITELIQKTPVLSWLDMLGRKEA